MKLNVSMKRVLSFLMALVMVLGMLPTGGLHIHAHAAEAVTMTGGEVLYLKPNSNWLVDNARFAAYFFGSSHAWTSMEPVPGNEGYYQLTVPEGSWTNVIFCRMSPNSGTNDWNNKWNQTADLAYDGENNLFTVPEGSWDGASTGWSTWEPVCVHSYADGICTLCGGYEPAFYNEETGVYEIGNAGQLYWYAQELNENNAEIYAKLTADITIPENAPNWEPINSSYAYFDGNFKTISGLKCIGGDAQYVGLFGYEGWWYEISNLHITNSYFDGSGYVGAVVACMTNGGSVTNCCVTDTTVTGDGDYVGALAGYLSMGSMINCFVDKYPLTGGYSSGYVSIENSYYLSAEETEDGGKTAAQFASGEVAFLLQAGQQPGYDYDEEGNEIEVPAAEVWGQKIGVDEFPVLGGQKVYQGYGSCADRGYTNSPNPSPERPDHSGEIEYTPNADGTTHSSAYSCCGEVVTENEAHTRPLTWVNLGEAGHISYYPCCQRAEDVETVPHSYDEATLLCGCGEVSSDVAAIVIVGETVTGYTDAAEALKAATSGATVRLLKDATLTESVEANDSLNLYLCGHTLTLADGVSLDAFCITVDGSDGENSISGTVTGNTEGGLLLYPEKLENVTVTNTHEAGYAVLMDFRITLEIPASGVALEGRLADVYLYDVHNYLSFPNGYQGDPISVAAYGPYLIGWCYPGGATVDWFISADENYVLWQEPGDTQRVYLRHNIVKQGIALSATEIVQAGEIPTVTAAGLTLDEDYTVAYYRDGAETTDLNENRGVVTVVITGMGDYAGTLELTYEVVCGHSEEPVNVNQGEDGHKVYCPGCQTAEDVETVPHSYDESTLLCSCGQAHPDAVVLVSMDGTPVRAFTDVEFAASNAVTYTAEDKAVLKLLKSVDLGEGNVNLYNGVYTLDLNGFAFTSSDSSSGAVCIYHDADLTICNGTIVGINNCIQLTEGKLTVSDVTCLEANFGIMMYDGELILRRCDIQTEYGMLVNSGSVTVYDSTFATDQDVDIREDGIVTFCEGTEFPGGLSVDGVSLESLLPEGMAYWTGNTMIVTQEGVGQIWGNVTVKAACTHEDSTTVYIPKDVDNHVIAYSCCFSGLLEPHSLDAEGKCTVCGFDPANSVIIRMTDSYGDGWGGNAIQIYEDGVLIDTTTVLEGSEASWICAYNPEKEYEFCWVKGNYATECSFELIVAGESVFTADRNDCNNYNDGYKFFPVCQHVYGEGVVIAPTCTSVGYTTYTCTLCGLSYKDNWQDSLGGHKKAEGDEGDVTAPTCISVGYTTYTCTVCGESYEDNLVDPLAHVLGEDGNCTVCGNLYSIPVYVSGNHVTSYNMADVLGDGTVSYDPTTNTLTLNGYRGSDIYMETSLNILLLGENTIETEDYGIFCYFHAGTVSISGTGSLDIISGYESVYMECSSVTLTIGGSATLNLMGAEEGIYLFADTAELVIRDNATVIIGTEEAPMEEECIYVDGDITGSVTITDNASVTCVTADEEGIFVGGEHSYLTISGNANVYVAGDDEGLDAEFITISGGTVTTIGGAGNEGIYTRVLTVSGGAVTAEGEDQGIEAEEIIITGGTVTAIGGMIASVGDFMTPGTITLGEGMGITAPKGAALGELDMNAEGEGFVLAVLNPDGTMANNVTITAVDTTLRIVTQPTDCQGFLGDSAEFTVVAEGEGLTYQWYYFDKGTNDWLKSYSPGSTTATLEPVFYAYRDGQQYRCVITDAEGNTVTTDSVAMTLRSSEIGITDISGDVAQGTLGRTYTFSVSATGDNLSYRWEYSADGGETWVLTWLEGYNTDTLTVKLNLNRDGNLYRCVITSAGKDSITSEPMGLHLQAESVQILGQPENVRVLTGETATFTVVATGNDLSYTWFRSDDNGVTWEKTYLPGYDTDTLSFQANLDRAVKFHCKVTDGSGKTVSTAVVKLSILPEILTQPENFTCGAGQTAAFVVTAQGEGLKYRWYYSADGGETWTETWLPGYNTDILFFQVNASRAAKIYKCVITGRYGDVVETAAVSVTID